jgi:protein involved in sex pheromone biosynthesis
MKRILLALFVCVFSLSGCSSTEKEEKHTQKPSEKYQSKQALETNVALNTVSLHEVYYVTSNALNVRLAPNVNGKKTNTLYKRQRVDVYEVKNGWSRISSYYDGALEGENGLVARWVSNKYLSKTMPKEESTKNNTAEYSNADTYAGCVSRGIAYFKIIGSYPNLTDGRTAESASRERCGRTKRAFDFN